MQYQALTDLLNDCSLPVSIDGRLVGSIFFVAPGYLLTCAHVIESVKDNPERISFRWQGNDFSISAVHLNFPKPYPDLALLRADVFDHPCVLLDEHAEPWHDLYSFGHTTKFPQGDPGTFELEGTGKIPGHSRPGLLGAAPFRTTDYRKIQAGFGGDPQPARKEDPRK